MIGENVEVTVMEVKGCQVRIGIKAPSDVSIDRNEIRVKKDAERRLS